MNRTAVIPYLKLLLVTVLYTCGTSMTLYTSAFIVSLGGTAEMAGRVIFVSILPFLLLAVFSGHLSARFGSRWLIVTGALVHLLTRLAYTQLTSASPWFFLLAFTSGLGHVLVFTPLFAAVGRALPARQRAAAFAYFSVAVQTGNTIGTFAGELIQQSLGYSAMYLASAALVVFAGAAAFTLREDMIAPNDLPTVPEGKRLAAIMPVAGGLVIVLLLGAVLGSALQFVPLFLINLYESGQVAKAIPLRSFLSTALLSMVMLRLVLFRLLSDAARHRLLVFCHTGIILTLLAIPLIRSIWSSVALAVAFGLSYGLLYPTMNALVLNRTAEHWRGRVSGLLTLLFESGFRGFALIAGTVSFYLGYAAMFYVLAAVYSLGLFFYWLLDRCRY